MRCAQSIQSSFEAFNLASAEKLQVRIGLHAGEPIEDSNDLFGATVQMAARLCAEAKEDTIIISDKVRKLIPADIMTRDLGSRSLKGFAEPVALHEVSWR